MGIGKHDINPNLVPPTSQLETCVNAFVQVPKPAYHWCSNPFFSRRSQPIAPSKFQQMIHPSQFSPDLPFHSRLIPHYQIAWYNAGTSPRVIPGFRVASLCCRGHQQNRLTPSLALAFSSPENHALKGLQTSHPLGTTKNYAIIFPRSSRPNTWLKCNCLYSE